MSIWNRSSNRLIKTSGQSMADREQLLYQQRLAREQEEEQRRAEEEQRRQQEEIEKKRKAAAQKDAVVKGATGLAGAVGAQTAVNSLTSSGAGAAAGTAAASAAPAAPSIIGGTSSTAAGMNFAPGLTASGAPAATSSFGAGTQGLSSLLGSMAVPAAGAGVAAFYGPSAVKYGKDALEGKQLKEGDSAVKSALMMNPMTAWATPVLDAAGISIKSGKGEGQRRRDVYRDHGQEVGLIDDDWRVKTSDGYIDVGAESLNYNGQDVEGAVPFDRGYNLDMNDKQSQELIGAVQPLASLIWGENAQNQDANQMTSYLVSGAKLSGDPDATVRGYYEQAGVDRDTAYGAVLQKFTNGELDNHHSGASAEQVRDAYLASVDKTFGVAPGSAPTQSSGGSVGASQPVQTSAPSPQPSLPPPPPFQPSLNTNPEPRSIEEYTQDIIDVHQYNSEGATGLPSLNERVDELLLNPLTARSYYGS